MSIITFTDNTVINFGMHKGKTLANVPASWLLYMYDIKGFDKQSPLGRYITDNLAVLKQQKKDDDRTFKHLTR